MRAPRKPQRQTDDGFTLVEVIVAMALLGLVATAGLASITAGLATTAQLQRRQVAVAVANQAMEQVHSLPASTVTVTAAGGAPTSIPAVLRGRTSVAVAAQWAASTAPDLAATTAVYDPSATTASTPAVPMTATQVLSGQRYTTNVLIGTCVRSAATSTACTASGTGTTQVRVVVEVTWTSKGAGACGPTGCVYRLSTLLDPDVDLQWQPS